MGEKYNCWRALIAYNLYITIDIYTTNLFQNPTVD